MDWLLRDCIGFLYARYFFALNIAFIGYYQSVTSAGRAMVFTMLRGIIFSVAAFMLLPSIFGIMGLWLSIPAAELATLLIITILHLRK